MHTIPEINCNYELSQLAKLSIISLMSRHNKSSLDKFEFELITELARMGIYNNSNELEQRIEDLEEKIRYKQNDMIDDVISEVEEKFEKHTEELKKEVDKILKAGITLDKIYNTKDNIQIACGQVSTQIANLIDTISSLLEFLDAKKPINLRKEEPVAKPKIQSDKLQEISNMLDGANKFFTETKNELEKR